MIYREIAYVFANPEGSAHVEKCRFWEGKLWLQSRPHASRVAPEVRLSCNQVELRVYPDQPLDDFYTSCVPAARTGWKNLPTPGVSGRPCLFIASCGIFSPLFIHELMKAAGDAVLTAACSSRMWCPFVTLPKARYNCLQAVNQRQHMTDPRDPLRLHEQLGGKIQIQSKVEPVDSEALGAYYTPGVGRVSRYLADNPGEVGRYTIKNNLVAVISDGSAVLGLGNIGPEGALPVMEGKAMLFDRLGEVEAMPLVLDTQDTEAIIAAVRAVAPVFGGINLEDISAPRAYEIERRLQDELDIPVMHDDQHATAIVVLAGLINACRVTGRELAQSRAVVVGAGAAGSATVKLLAYAGVEDIIVLDSRGIITSQRGDLDQHKQHLAELSNPRHLNGSIKEALVGADIVVGVSGPDIITSNDIQSMADSPIVFALSNPDPEVMPGVAREAGAAVVATGRSDFPNQINNVLVFPGVFRGLLDSGTSQVTDAIKAQASRALADLVGKPGPEHIIPHALDPAVPGAVAAAVSTAKEV